MLTNIDTLIWLFPIAFMLHDFEEIILGEPWLRKNGRDILARVPKGLPAVFTRQLSTIIGKAAYQFSSPICLIFVLTSLASFLAVVHHQYGFFILASGMFFLHGFMHIGQAILLRKYIPAVITSILVVIPYGLVLFRWLIAEGIVNVSGLPLYAILAVLLIIPFTLLMHIVGEYLYDKATRLLVG